MLTKQQILKKRKLLNGKEKEIADIFKTLSDENRCKIFRILATEPKLSVSATSKVLNISLPLTSQHLKILLHKHLLEKEKDGQMSFYKIKRDNPIAHAILKVINQYIKNLN